MASRGALPPGVLTDGHSFEDAVDGEREDDDEAPDGRQELLLLGGRAQHRLLLLRLLILGLVVVVVVAGGVGRRRRRRFGRLRCRQRRRRAAVFEAALLVFEAVELGRERDEAGQGRRRLAVDVLVEVAADRFLAGFRAPVFVDPVTVPGVPGDFVRMKVGDGSGGVAVAAFAVDDEDRVHLTVLAAET